MSVEQKRAWLPLFVFAVTVAVFLPALGGEFLTVDDGAMVFTNPGVLQGFSLAGLKWAFTTWYWGMWHPLTWVSHQLDVSLFGLDPRGHHAMSVLLHALTVTLAFVFLRDATGQPNRAALAALLFGLHPLRAESVAWVAERKDVLCALFGVLACLLYVRYRRAPSIRRWLGVALALAAALLCKPMAVTFPLVLLLLDFWPLQTSAWRPRLLEKLPLLAMAAGASALTVFYQRSVEAVSQAPWADRLARAACAYGLELWHTVAPVGLSYLYPRETPPAWAVALSVLALIALLCSAWLVRRRAPSWTMGVAWFLGVMFPTVGLVQVGAQLTADRYAYFPHLGLFAGAVFAVPAVSGRFRRSAALGAVALLLLWASLLLGQLFVWRSSARLFAQALERDPNNVMALHSLALLQTQGDALDEGLATFRRALALTPNDGFIWSNYGRALMRKGDLAGALDATSRGFAARPGDPMVREAHGEALASLGRCAEAVTVLRPLMPDPPPAARVEDPLAHCLLVVGGLDEAWAAYAQGLRRFPADTELPLTAAESALRLGRFDLCDQWLAEAKRRAPADPRVAALEQRRRDEAERHRE